MKAEALKIEAIRDNYARLQKEAARKEEMLRRKAMVRIGTASCGIAAGALKVKEAFEREIAARDLDAAVVEVGCMGHCYAEPLCVISKPGFVPFCYGNVDEGLAGG